MKKLMYALLAVVFMAACQPEQDNSTLGELKTEKDSLSTLQQQIALRLKAIEDEIIKLDSTQKLHLVSAMEIKPQDFQHFFSIYGVVESNQSISLYAESSGKIESIKVKRGQKVARGQLLAKLDNQILKQNLEELKTSYELAKEIYEKQSRLWLEEKIGSEVQYLEAKNNKESLERRIETIEAQIEKTEVRAPFSGVVDEIFPKTGEMASPQMPMFRLVNLNDVYLTASVSEAYIGTVQTGTMANVYFSALDTTIASEVVRVGSYINPDNRTFDVNIALNKNANFKPNMMGKVDLQDYSTKDAIVVPSSLVLENMNGQSYLYVVEPVSGNVAHVKKVMVQTGYTYNGQTEIKSGLAANQLVVNKGARSVKDGQSVRVVKH